MAKKDIPTKDPLPELPTIWGLSIQINDSARAYIRRHHKGVLIQESSWRYTGSPKTDPTFYTKRGALKRGWYKKKNGFTYYFPPKGELVTVVDISIKDKITTKDESEIMLDALYHEPERYLFREYTGVYNMVYFLTFRQDDFSRLFVGDAKNISRAQDIAFAQRPWYLVSSRSTLGTYRVVNRRGIFVALDASKGGEANLERHFESPRVEEVNELSELLEQSSELKNAESKRRVRMQRIKKRLPPLK